MGVESCASERPFRTSLSRQDIHRDFEKLIEERKLSGAELDPTILKKSGKGTRFLISRVPTRAKLFATLGEPFR